MLAELTILAFSPARMSIRRIGLLGKAVALWSRATRCKRLWAEHEARCHRVILEAVDRLPRRHTVLVLGSGLCRDVPLAELAARFRRVVLVDAVHLWPVRVRIRRHGNVELRSRDLTGAVEWLLGERETRQLPLADFQADADVDLVVSANCLSQLPLGLYGWLEKDAAQQAKWGAEFPARAVGWHLEDLAGFNCPACLLTDVTSRELSTHGALLHEEDLMRGHALPLADATWDWVVAPCGEQGRAHEQCHVVQAWTDIGPALRAGPHHVCKEVDQVRT